MRIWAFIQIGNLARLDADHGAHARHAVGPDSDDFPGAEESIVEMPSHDQCAAVLPARGAARPSRFSPAPTRWCAARNRSRSSWVVPTSVTVYSHWNLITSLFVLNKWNDWNGRTSEIGSMSVFECVPVVPVVFGANRSNENSLHAVVDQHRAAFPVPARRAKSLFHNLCGVRETHWLHGRNRCPKLVYRRRCSRAA